MDSESSTNFSVNDDRLISKLGFDPGCRVEYSFVDGRKEGSAIVYSQNGLLLGKLHYQNDNLHGLCIFNNANGEKEREIEFENDVANGWYCIYENMDLLEMGINKNGQKFSELCEFSEDPSFLQETRDGEVISVCRYNETHKKDGFCYHYENGVVASVTLFEDGIELYKLFQLDGESMTEYGRDGKILYVGEWKGSIMDGYSRSGRGRCVEYEGDTVVKVVFLENGVEKGYQKFGKLMKEFNEKRIVLYEGEFSGSVASGFVRNGIGTCFISENQYYVGEFSDGVEQRRVKEIVGEEMVEMNEEGHVIYIGGYTGNSKRNGKGKLLLYAGEVLKKIVECENGNPLRTVMEFEDDIMTEYNEEGNRVYSGKFHGDFTEGFERDGEGTEFDGEGKLVYMGEWKQNKKEGFGRYYVNSELRFTGEWKNDQPDGEGVYEDQEKEVRLDGVWKEGSYNNGEKEFAFGNEKTVEETSKVPVEHFEIEVSSPVEDVGVETSRVRGYNFAKIAEERWRGFKRGMVCSTLLIMMVVMLVLFMGNTWIKERVDRELVVSNDYQCSRLLDTHWRVITVNEGLCNKMTLSWVIERYENLEKLVVKGGSLRNVKSLEIRDSNQLRLIEIGGDSAFENVESVKISSSLVWF